MFKHIYLTVTGTICEVPAEGQRRWTKLCCRLISDSISEGYVFTSHWGHHLTKKYIVTLVTLLLFPR